MYKNKTSTTTLYFFIKYLIEIEATKPKRMTNQSLKNQSTHREEKFKEREREMPVLWWVENAESQTSKNFYLVFSSLSQLPRNPHPPTISIKVYSHPLNHTILSPLQTYSPLSLSLISPNMYGLHRHHTCTELKFISLLSLSEEEDISWLLAHTGLAFLSHTKTLSFGCLVNQNKCGLCVFLLSPNKTKWWNNEFCPPNWLNQKVTIDRDSFYMVRRFKCLMLKFKINIIYVQLWYIHTYIYIPKNKY